jgi:hypothetical protein
MTVRRAVLRPEPSEDTATTCDECETPIPYGTTCYCAACHMTRSEVPF